MKYVVINNAEDGRHVSMYATRHAAAKYVDEIIGRVAARELGQPYYSDWGQRLVIEERPDHWTVRLEKQVRAAYDARECGTASKFQTALLEGLGW